MTITRRTFLRRSGAVVVASATPLWAQWLGDQMRKLQPKRVYQVPALLEGESVPVWPASDPRITMLSNPPLYTYYVGLHTAGPGDGGVMSLSCDVGGKVWEAVGDGQRGRATSRWPDGELDEACVTTRAGG